MFHNSTGYISLEQDSMYQSYSVPWLNELAIFILWPKRTPSQSIENCRQPQPQPSFRMSSRGTSLTTLLPCNLFYMWQVVKICCGLGVSCHKWNCFAPVWCSRRTTTPQIRFHISDKQLILWSGRKVVAISKVMSQLEDKGASEPSHIRSMFNASTWTLAFS